MKIPLFYRLLAASVLFLAVLWNEWLCYKHSAATWRSQTAVKKNCTKMLLVADPQLIGYKNEPPFVGPISRWDSDRYLANGFDYATAHVNPELIIFIGDLFDEGLTATEEEFDATLSRFRSIFPIGYEQAEIYIPGDNDIGGEGELIEPEARQRFKNTFKSRFQKIPYSFYEVYLFESKTLNLLHEAMEEKLKIMLTHVPYLTYYASFIDTGQGVDLILSGHDHYAMIYEMDRRPSGKLFSSRPDYASSTFKEVIGRQKRVVELQVPTCSYRMGVPEMGYGQLTVCEHSAGNMTIQFDILWLPSRYKNLTYYVGAVIVSVAIIWYGSTAKNRRRKQAWFH